MNNYWKLSPIPLAFGAFVWYGSTVKAEQLPPCMDINLLQASVQHKSEIQVKWMNIFKARASVKTKKMEPCKMPGRIRGADGLCWKVFK